MATANGFWWNGNADCPFAACVSNRKARSPEPRKQRKHHYTFDVDDNGLDINGFILHTDKHEGKRHKFRVHLDSNENGRFDKNDELIGRTGLKQKHVAKGVGNLLDEDELGQLEVKFKRAKSEPSMKSTEDAETPIWVKEMSFKTDSEDIAEISPAGPSWQECSRFACQTWLEESGPWSYPDCDSCEKLMTIYGCTSFATNQAITMMKYNSDEASCVCG